MTPREYLDQHPELERIILKLKRAGDVRAIVTFDDLRERLSREDAEALMDYLRHVQQVVDLPPKPH